MKNTALACLLIATTSHQANAQICQGSNSDVAVHQLIEHPSWNQEFIVAGCYLGTRHGTSIQDCKARPGSGLWIEFVENLKTAPAVVSFRKSAFRQPLHRESKPLPIRAKGLLVKRDTYVPGGTVLLITEILCFAPLPEDKGRDTALQMEQPI